SPRRDQGADDARPWLAGRPIRAQRRLGPDRRQLSRRIRRGSMTTVESSPLSVGSLVRVRDREWVVLPGSDAELLMVRPLGGTDAETTGILTGLETVVPATFARPDPTDPGDYRSARLLRDALRLGFRSSAGPFRSFGHIAVEPRPYQLVPLLM